MPARMWLQFIRKMFGYIFDADYKFGGLPQVELKPLDGPLALVRRTLRARDRDPRRN